MAVSNVLTIAAPLLIGDPSRTLTRHYSCRCGLSNGCHRLDTLVKRKQVCATLYAVASKRFLSQSASAGTTVKLNIIPLS